MNYSTDWDEESDENECEGHEPEPGSNDPMGVTVFCDGTCR